MPIRQFLYGLVTAAAVLPQVVLAEDRDLALNGADTVAYFNNNEFQPGSETFALMWRGQEWRFTNAEHRAAFEMNPFAYVPAYNGQCAVCLANGHVVAGDPAVWSVIDGQLYLNRTDDLGEEWEQRYSSLRPVADAAWDRFDD